jgi:murein DD-endopeptidase MepM/ murein hydrolase activator NlpD
VPPRIPRSSDDSDNSPRPGRALRTGALLSIPAAAAAVAIPLTAGASNGGATFIASPKPSKVQCVSSCMPRKAVRAGGSIRVAGKQLAGVRKVIFGGGRGSADDVTVVVSPTSDRAIKLTVPITARSGPLTLWAGDSAQAKTAPVKIMPPPPPIASAELTPSDGPSDPGAPALETGTSSTGFFVGSRGGVEFKYRVGGASPVHAQVNLIRQGDGAVVQTWDAPSVAPGQVQSVRWNGRAAGGIAPEGRYMFLLSVTYGTGLAARSAGANDGQRDAFDLHHFVFPVRGKHNYGQSEARFGAGRGGRSHQGQDVMAACGTKLVAARGGKVKFSGFQGAAGNYVVIDLDGDDQDHVYMHLAQPSPLQKGDRVYTNQAIGVVGDTGSASACHLHFEIWSPPGWYSGGAPRDPVGDLEAWDRYS